VFLNGEEIAAPDPGGRHVRDDSFFLLFNAHDQPLRFTLPRGRTAGAGCASWTRPTRCPASTAHGGQVPVTGRSLALLRKVE